MQLTGLIGKKVNQTQGFLEDGTRVPISIVSVAGNHITHIKTQDKDGYMAVQLGFDKRKKPTKAEIGHSKKAGLDKTPRFFREIRVDAPLEGETGVEVIATEVLKPGDILDVSGVSKGKGYAGVVKRYHFRGGPKTHGQSDRHRAPGSSGQGTTPGRVYKGKRMAGRMGNAQVTVKNLQVLDVTAEQIFIKGLIPGPRGSVVVLVKTGEDKKFKSLFKEASEEATEETQVTTTPTESVKEPEVETATEEVQTAENTVEDTEEAVADATETVETPTKEAATEKEQTEEKEKNAS